jgi:hypothetical protein
MIILKTACRFPGRTTAPSWRASLLTFRPSFQLSCLQIQVAPSRFQASSFAGFGIDQRLFISCRAKDFRPESGRPGPVQKMHPLDVELFRVRLNKPVPSFLT